MQRPIKHIVFLSLYSIYSFCSFLPESFEVVLRGTGFSGAKRIDNVLCSLSIDNVTHCNATLHFAAIFFVFELKLRIHLFLFSWIKSVKWNFGKISELEWKLRVMSCRDKQWLLFIGLILWTEEILWCCMEQSEGFSPIN